MMASRSFIFAWIFLALSGFIFGIVLSKPHVEKHVITQDTYKAAVLDKAPMLPYPYQRVLSRQEALSLITDFVDLFERKTAEAAAQGVDIIVFPEYGLYPSGASRDAMLPFLESIPDPEEQWNPCLQPDRHPDTDLQRHLSCMARKNYIYVVANIGDRVPCEESVPHCVGGRLQYNTNVAYDPQGTHVARYHKQNLFFEYRYDTPAVPEYSYFDTPFGRLGTVICFDLLFEEPALGLVEDFNIDTMVFPTAWMNVLPYFSAVPFHQAYAIGSGVNLLGSNLHAPFARFSGSGVYGYNTTIVSRNDDNSLDAALLIGKVNSSPTKTPQQNVIIEPTENVDFTSDIFGDTYNFVAVKGTSGAAKVCSDSLCCEVNYKRETHDSSEFFALGAFRGLHVKEGVYFMEVCAFLKCSEGPENHCEDGTIRTSNTHFSYVNVTGSYSTKYVYPQFVSSEIDPSAGAWKYDGRSIVSHDSSQAFLSAIALGRRFDLDDPNVTPEPPGGNTANRKA